MKAINTDFSFYRALNAEHYAAHLELKALLTRELATKYSIVEPYLGYDGAFDDEEDCFKPNRAYLATDILARLDADCDHLYNFGSQVVAAGCVLPIPELAEACKRLSYEFNNHKGLSELSYEAETGMLADFLQKMEEPQNAADLETMSLTRIITALRAKHGEFRVEYAGRVNEEFVRDTSAKMKQLRPITDDKAREYFHAINVVYQMNELVTKDPETKAELEALIDAINAIINHYQKKIATRRNTDTPEPNPDNKPADGTTPTPDTGTDTEGDGTDTTPDTGDGTEGGGTDTTPDTGGGTEGGGTEGGGDDDYDDGGSLVG